MSRAFLLAFFAACTGPSATLVVTTGGEDANATFTASPAVATIEIDSVVIGGAPTQIFSSALVQNTTFDLADISQETVASLQFNGIDSNGDVVVFGATPNAELGALSGDVPLFVQRRGQFARLPNPLPDGRRDPFLAITNTNLYVAGGTIDGASGNPPLTSYDLLNLGPSDTLDAPQAATSFALIQFAQQTVPGDSAAAMWLNATNVALIGLNESGNYFSDGATACSTFDCPDVAGGQTVIGDDDAAYILGASGASTVSSAVLVLDPEPDANGNPQFETPSTSPRHGATVAWAPSRGVFIYGGTTDAQYTQIEILSKSVNSSGGTTFALNALPYTTPISSGSFAAIAFDANRMLLAGDGGTPQTADLRCEVSCQFAPWGVATNVALTSPALFSLGGTQPAFLLIGDDSSGATRAFHLDAQSANEVKLNIPRQGARAIQTLLGAVLIVGGIVGGGSATIESYVP